MPVSNLGEHQHFPMLKPLQVVQLPSLFVSLPAERIPNVPWNLYLTAVVVRLVNTSWNPVAERLGITAVAKPVNLRNTFSRLQ